MIFEILILGTVVTLGGIVLYLNHRLSKTIRALNGLTKTLKREVLMAIWLDIRHQEKLVDKGKDVQPEYKRLENAMRVLGYSKKDANKFYQRMHKVNT